MRHTLFNVFLMSLMMISPQTMLASYSTQSHQINRETPSWSDVLLKAEAYYHASEEQKQQTVRGLRQIIIQGDSEMSLQAALLLQEFRSHIARDYPDINAKQLEASRGSYGRALLKQGRQEEGIDVLIKEAYYFSAIAQIALMFEYESRYERQPELAGKIRAYYDKSAAEGAPREQLMLGKIYAYGWGPLRISMAQCTGI